MDASTVITTNDRPLTPEARRLSDDVLGIECRLGDGNIWLIARCGAEVGLDEIRDRVFDDAAYLEKAVSGVYLLAFRVAILKNYDLSIDEADELFVLSDRQTRPIIGGIQYPSVDEAICGAFIAPFDPGEFTYSDWLGSSLVLNGIDPSSISSELLPAVVNQLVRLGRCLPLTQFVGSAVKGEEMRAHRSMLHKQTETPAQP